MDATVVISPRRVDHQQFEHAREVKQCRLPIVDQPARRRENLARRRTAVQGGLLKGPLAFMGPECHFELVLDVEQPHPDRIAFFIFNHRPDDRGAPSSSVGVSLAPTFERRDSRQRLGKQGPWLSDFG
jgi:hypothetical protein